MSVSEIIRKRMELRKTRAVGYLACAAGLTSSAFGLGAVTYLSDLGTLYILLNVILWFSVACQWAFLGAYQATTMALKIMAEAIEESRCLDLD